MFRDKPSDVKSQVRRYDGNRSSGVSLPAGQNSGHISMITLLSVEPKETINQSFRSKF